VILLLPPGLFTWESGLHEGATLQCRQVLGAGPTHGETAAR